MQNSKAVVVTLLFTLMVLSVIPAANAATRVAMIEVKGMVCNA